jgi:hypothetical protein
MSNAGVMQAEADVWLLSCCHGHSDLELTNLELRVAEVFASYSPSALEILEIPHSVTGLR